MPKQAQGSAAPPIYENYKDYQPPKFARPTIAKLLSEIPSNYLAGLDIHRVDERRGNRQGKNDPG